MLALRSLFILVAAAGVTVALAASARAQTNAAEILARDANSLVAIVTNSEAPVFEKAKACQRLAVSGTAEAVPALAALLTDETLNLYARFALERIADPAVDEALRKAAGQLRGRPLVGVVNSIGQRRDRGAVELLQGLLGSEDSAVASAAAGALGRIGTIESGGILKRALAAESSPLTPSLADGCLTCADRLGASREKAEAVALLNAVSEANVAKHLRVAALYGLFRLQQAEAKDLLLTQIRSEDAAFFNLALAAARKMPGAEVTAALVKELDALPSEREALLLLAVGDRADAPELSVVIRASKSDSEVVRAAAIQVLARFAEASAVNVLLDLALGKDEVARSAQQSLKTSAFDSVDPAIVARLREGDVATQIALLDLVGSRRITAAVPTVRSALAAKNPELRSAAVTAFGQLVELGDLDLLTNRALEGGNPAEATAAKSALQTAALRMSDRDGCVVKLAAHLSGTNNENQVFLLELLGQISGPKALDTVVATAKSKDAALKDAGTRILGDWVNADAAPALLELAKSDADAKYRIRCLRGYVRIARQLQLSEEARLTMFQTAMQVAERNEEKQLSLDILTRIPSKATLELAVSHLQQPPLKAAAAEAAVKIAPKLIASEPKAVAAAMRKVTQAEVGGKTGELAAQLLQQAGSGK